jgi:anti-anti-sigma factor
MIIAHLMHWFTRPVRRVSSAHSPFTAPGLPPVRSRRPAAVVPAFRVTINQTARDMVIRVEGEARYESAGELLAGLMAPAACRPPIVILDLSELRSISCLAMGVLVAYRRGVVRTGGQVRLGTELQPAVREALARAELLSLFETTPETGTTPHRLADPAQQCSSDVVAA